MGPAPMSLSFLQETPLRVAVTISMLCSKSSMRTMEPNWRHMKGMARR